MEIIIFTVIIGVIFIVWKATSNKKTLTPPNSNSTASEIDTGEYITLDEYEKITRNSQAENKNVSEPFQLVGNISGFNNSNLAGCIVSDNDFYNIIFQRNFNYNDFPNKMPKTNDKVIFQPQIVNGNYYASNIKYYRPNLITNVCKSEEWRNMQKWKELKEFISNVKNNAEYLIALEQFYLIFYDIYENNKMKELINEFIELYQLDTKFYLSYENILKDLQKIDKQYEAEFPKKNKSISNHKSSVVQTQTVTNTQSAHKQNNKNQPSILPKGNESFYIYVTNFSDIELINTISNQYKTLKGRWNVAPCMGIYGSIEYAAVLLLWKYAINNFNKNPSAYGSLQITLGDVIGCSFFGMPAGEWSDKVDKILHSHDDIVSYAEFGNVYNYLKNHFADEIHSLEFNEGNAQKESYQNLYAKFTKTYNSADDFKETIYFYTANGLKIKDDIHFDIANDNKDISKTLLAQEWKHDYGYLMEDAEIQQLPPFLTDKFYISSYRCPICGRHMYKTVFPIGSEFPIKIENGLVSMKRIFTCKTCLRFFTPLPEQKLSCGQYYSLRLETLNEYKMLLETYDNHGTTDGRPDA